MNAPRLVQLATGYPALKGLWAMLAICTLSSINAPGQIPLVYRMAIQESIRSRGSKLKTRLQDKQESQELENSARQALGTSELQGYGAAEEELTLQIREALFKSCVITGAPKAINSLLSLRSLIPDPLDTQLTKTTLPASALEQRGQVHFDKIYNKVLTRVQSNLNRAYPPLHDFLLHQCYGSVFSDTSILSSKETSLTIVASLVLQDVNPQLKGHLRGSLNVGSSIAEAQQTRQLALDLCIWNEICLNGEPYSLDPA